MLKPFCPPADERARAGVSGVAAPWARRLAFGVWTALLCFPELTASC